ncbi:hypothetical protein CCACVL1_24803 [Corchorus capsularis]|uniref:Uncharacterized protein n=1 Tax=Corchorus capsularis TaxID=210143 RepID=A0A1R3GMX6_COCAP|nr:hypothetical protein CCACVL1_24803 [Corchorus capsularis]
MRTSSGKLLKKRLKMGFAGLSQGLVLSLVSRARFGARKRSYYSTHTEPKAIMPRTFQSSSRDKAGSFFSATLLLWLVSVLFEIVFNKRRELFYILAVEKYVHVQLVNAAIQQVPLAN